MSRKKNRKGPTKLELKIMDTTRLIYRVLKNKKLFGTYMTRYKPLDNDSIDEVCGKMDNEYALVINGLEMNTDRMSKSFGDTLRTAYLVLRYTKTDSFIEKVSMNNIMIYLCQHYFNDNRDKYEIKINQLKFETIFGVIFLMMGLCLLSTAIYAFVGYIALVCYLTFIYIVSILGKVYLTK